MSQLLTTSDVAKILLVATETVRFYENTGRLPATRTANGTRLFQPSDVEEFRIKREKREHARQALAEMGN